MKIDLNNRYTIASWKAVNDGVMGGRSSGAPSFENGYMVFEGNINTNGGGFSSIRTKMKPESLSNSSSLVLKVKSDGRAYKVTFRTNAYYRFRPISFQALIPQTKIGEWESVNVPFERLDASIFGRSVYGAKFDKSEVTELGIILADGEDGPFRLEVKEIQGC